MKTKPLTFLLALTFLFLFSVSVYGQEEVKKEYWENGKIKIESHYKDGIQNGLVFHWYESGEKKLKGEFKDGLPYGIWTGWNKDGTKKFSKKQVLKKIVFEKGANPYESKAIASALTNDMAEGLKYFIDSHFIWGKYSDFMNCEKVEKTKCRQNLVYRVDFKTASVDLNGDGKDEVIVEINAPNYCGSGGCTSHILQKSEEDGWQQIGSIFGGYDFTLPSIPENGFLPIYSKHVHVSSDKTFRKWVIQQ